MGIIREFENFDEAIESIENENVVKVKEPITTEFCEDDFLVVVNDNGYTLSKRLSRELFKMFGVSSKFVKGLDDDNPELQKQLLDLCFARNKNLQFLERGGDVRRLSTQPLVTHRELITAIKNAMPHDTRVWAGLDPDYKFECRCVTPEIIAHPKHDHQDESCGGIIISTNGSVRVGSYAYRLVCTNGMRAWSRKTYKIEGATPDMILRKVAQMVPKALERVEKDLLPKFVKSAEIPIGNPDSVLTDFMLRKGSNGGWMSADVRETIIKRIANDKPSLYDLINAVTEQARDDENDNEMFSTKLQVVAGDLTRSAELQYCGACGSVI
jgi:hypothetical protein